MSQKEIKIYKGEISQSVDDRRMVENEIDLTHYKIMYPTLTRNISLLSEIVVIRYH
jgi:hypothetical protein